MVIDYVRVYQNTASIDETTEQEIKLFPNPVSDTLNIQFNGKIDQIAIYNLLGVEVLNKNGLESTIDMKSLKSGIYFIKLQIGEQTIARKIVKE